MLHLPRISLSQESGPSEAKKKKQSTVAPDQEQPRWRDTINSELAVDGVLSPFCKWRQFTS